MSEGVVVNPISIDGKTIVLLHVPFSYQASIESVITLAGRLEKETGHKPVIVRGGRPSPGTASVYVARNDAATLRAIRKITANSRPGAIIPLADDEFEAVTKNMHAFG